MAKLHGESTFCFALVVEKLLDLSFLVFFKYRFSFGKVACIIFVLFIDSKWD